MRIQNQVQGPASTQRLQAPPNQEGRPADPPLTAQDLVLLGEIRHQERIMAAAPVTPWAAGVIGAASMYYLANHSLPLAGLVGLPVGLLIGAGLGEYLSHQAAFKINEAQAQLSSHRN